MAARPGTIEVSVQVTPDSSNLDAKLSLDLLSPGSWPARLIADSRPPPEASLVVMGHVARRGDVAVDAGGIAGPQSPSAIEGLELHCSGAHVGIVAQSTTAADDGRWSPWCRPGAFVGTRHQALPLTGLRLKLVGADAPAFAIAAEALFSGSPARAERGADPLIGLRLGLVPVAVAAHPAAPPDPVRVRVYR